MTIHKAISINNIREGYKQLDEDANDGYQMLLIAPEREGKLNIELKEHKTELKKKDVEIKDFFEEKQEFVDQIKVK